MKHLIIALLFLPMISFAQETEAQIKKQSRTNGLPILKHLN